MGPSNDHELAITIAINAIAEDGRLSLSSIPEIASSLHFMMSRSDSEFLVKYIHWRMDNPIAK
jgi:predicted HTH domain antitoxin